jgi:hypothetical protein
VASAAVRASWAQYGWSGAWRHGQILRVRALLVVTLVSVGCTPQDVVQDAGCAFTRVADEHGMVQANSPALYDCSAPACSLLSVCQESIVGPTAGSTPGCPPGETSCSDGADNNRNGFLDCADCGCCSDPACANSPACGCDELPAHFSLTGYARIDGGSVPACQTSGGGFAVTQNGCYVWFSSRTPAGSFRMAVGPQALIHLGPHRYLAGWSETTGTTTAMETDIYSAVFDTEQGTITGTWKRTQTSLSYPVCGIKAEKG